MFCITVFWICLRLSFFLLVVYHKKWLIYFFNSYTYNIIIIKFFKSIRRFYLEIFLVLISRSVHKIFNQHLSPNSNTYFRETIRNILLNYKIKYKYKYNADKSVPFHILCRRLMLVRGFASGNKVVRLVSWHFAKGNTIRPASYSQSWLNKANWSETNQRRVINCE